MPYAKVGNARLFYEVYGSELRLAGEKATTKPTLIVLHGGPGLDHTYLIPFLGSCAEFFQVIFMDHRGNGRSQDANRDNWNLKSWGEDVYNFCQTLGIDKPFILGVSFGGHVALQYSVLQPDHAGGIILIDTEGEFNVEEMLNAFEKKGGAEIRGIAAQLFKNPTPANQLAYMQRCLPLCTVKPMQADAFKYCIYSPEVSHHYTQGEFMTGFSFLPQLKNVSSPVLYLSGTSSPLHSCENAKKTASKFSSEVEFKAFDNCGLVSSDAQEKAIELIKKFVLKHHSV